MAEEKKKKKKRRSRIFETRYFGFVIAAFIILIFFALSEGTSILNNLERKVMDIHFRYKDLFTSEEVKEGVKVTRQNPDISEDILIVGIDFRTLSKMGQWPFPRHSHAKLLDTFTRIKNTNRRERAVLLDIFFNEPSDNAVNDGILVESIEQNNRVFLEPLLDEVPPPSEKEDAFIKRLKILIDRFGEVKNVSGPWKEMVSFHGIQPPLKPYAQAAGGYGHPNYIKDSDEVFRRQPMVAKYAEPIKTFPYRELTPESELNEEEFERFAWKDKEGNEHTIETPITEEKIDSLLPKLEARAPVREVDTDNDGKIDDSYYVIYKYRDHFLPSITLSLALEYFNKSIEDVEVKLGEFIRISKPQHFNTKKGVWEPYEIQTKAAEYDDDGNVVEEAKTRVLEEITIPIDEQANMLVNFMGPPSFASPGARQTFPIRSYAGYSSNPPGPDPNTWPSTRALGNKIIMVGAFTRGIAADHKPTPYGLMYGVEVHANALNTILMDNFLHHVPYWINLLILAGLVLITAFFVSRLSTIWAFIVSLVLVFALFLTSSLVFDRYDYIVNFTTPALATIFTFLSVVVYRVMTEEKDKKRIRNMFGTYVSPKVVDQILDNPPELGGVDKEITVFFSDIRGFTTISESMTPQELVKILNRYLTAMTDIILKYEGTLDKYEGDAIMSFWGAPVEQTDHALRACKASVEQIKALDEVNATLPSDQQLDIGIGLNSGKMTVGNMGSYQRMDYTLIGDNVNLGARLEGTNKEYQTRIIMSEYTYGLVSDYVIARELDNIRVKGKHKPVLIYELIDIKEDEEGNYLDVSESVSSGGKK